jgi:hypothetical protein
VSQNSQIVVTDLHPMHRAGTSVSCTRICTDPPFKGTYHRHTRELTYIRSVGCGWSLRFKLPFPEVWNPQGSAIDRPDFNPHPSGDPLPADALRAKRSSWRVAVKPRLS